MAALQTAQSSSGAWTYGALGSEKRRCSAHQSAKCGLLSGHCEGNESTSPSERTDCLRASVGEEEKATEVRFMLWALLERSRPWGKAQTAAVHRKHRAGTCSGLEMKCWVLWWTTFKNNLSLVHYTSLSESMCEACTAVLSVQETVRLLQTFAFPKAKLKVDFLCLSSTRRCRQWFMMWLYLDLWLWLGRNHVYFLVF